MNERILMVDDDPEIARTITVLLEKEGYQVPKAYNGMEALEQVVNPASRLIVIDVVMPRLDGLSAVTKIREKRSLPIIVLNAKSEDSNKVPGLSVGADDYIAKPFHPQGLVARMRSQLQRCTQLSDVSTQSQGGEIVNGRLCYRLGKRVLLVDGGLVKPTITELRIVGLLVRNLGQASPVEGIYWRVWNEETYATKNTVMVHIRRIWERIELNPKEPKYLKAVWGIGYKIERC